jgi:hypothetical protein
LAFVSGLATVLRPLVDLEGEEHAERDDEKLYCDACPVTAAIRINHAL